MGKQPIRFLVWRLYHRHCTVETVLQRLYRRDFTTETLLQRLYRRDFTMETTMETFRRVFGKKSGFYRLLSANYLIDSGGEYSLFLFTICCP